jgi:hypothetical protein
MKKEKLGLFIESYDSGEPMDIFETLIRLHGDVEAYSWVHTTIRIYNEKYHVDPKDIRELTREQVRELIKYEGNEFRKQIYSKVFNIQDLNLHPRLEGHSYNIDNNVKKALEDFVQEDGTA